jgi:hypothetical protein
MSKPGTVVTPSIAFAGGVVSVKNAALITPASYQPVIG